MPPRWARSARGSGAASGAGLWVLAVLTTGIYLVVALAFPVLTRRLPRSATAISALRVRYPDGRGLSRQVLQAATELGCGTAEMLAGSQARTRPASHRPARG